MKYKIGDVVRYCPIAYDREYHNGYITHDGTDQIHYNKKCRIISVIDNTVKIVLPEWEDSGKAWWVQDRWVKPNGPKNKPGDKL